MGTEPAPPWDPTFALSLQTGGVFRGRGVAGSGGDCGTYRAGSLLVLCSTHGACPERAQERAPGVRPEASVLCPMPPSPQNVRWELFEARRAPLGLTRGKWGGRQLPMLGEGGEGHRTPSMVTSEEAES